MPTMRAKFSITSIEQFSNMEKLNLAAVTSSSKPYGPNGENEDNTFARYTPQGGMSLTVTNPDLLGRFKPGQRFYLDFTEAAE